MSTTLAALSASLLALVTTVHVALLDCAIFAIAGVHIGLAQYFGDSWRWGDRPHRSMSVGAQ